MIIEIYTTINWFKYINKCTLATLVNLSIVKCQNV